jgi:hypothetical protein
MNAVIIVLVVVVVVGAIALLAFNPLVAKQSQRSVDLARAELGGPDQVRLLESRAVGFATEPEEAGGRRGQGCLAANDSTLLFVTTAGQKQFRIARSDIERVDTSGDPRSNAKATVIVTYRDAEHGEVDASWRVPDPTSWLIELGYDWGAEGPPAPTDDD